MRGRCISVPKARQGRSPAGWGPFLPFGVVPPGRCAPRGEGIMKAPGLHNPFPARPDDPDERPAITQNGGSWLSLCRDCVADIDLVLAELPTRTEREPVLRSGEGGDDTTAIDAAAEDAVVARLAALESDFLLVSEELGERSFGAGGPMRVIVDPIDGSVNAKRGIPFFSLSLAVAEGPAMADVTFGYVYDFGAREEWVAERGRGARLNGRPLESPPPKDPIEILSFEATTTAYIADKAASLLGVAERLRVMGSLALSLCHLAAGRVDAVCSLKAARSIDIAAAQLLVRERGYAIELFEDPPFEAAPLDLVGRSRLVAAATPALCAELADALR